MACAPCDLGSHERGGGAGDRRRHPECDAADQRTEARRPAVGPWRGEPAAERRIGPAAHAARGTVWPCVRLARARLGASVARVAARLAGHSGRCMGARCRPHGPRVTLGARESLDQRCHRNNPAVTPRPEVFPERTLVKARAFVRRIGLACSDGFKPPRDVIDTFDHLHLICYLTDPFRRSPMLLGEVGVRTHQLVLTWREEEGDSNVFLGGAQLLLHARCADVCTVVSRSIRRAMALLEVSHGVVMSKFTQRAYVLHECTAGLLRMEGKSGDRLEFPPKAHVTTNAYEIGELDSSADTRLCVHRRPSNEAHSLPTGPSLRRKELKAFQCNPRLHLGMIGGVTDRRGFVELLDEGEHGLVHEATRS